jgi:hypothetical protein
VTEIPLGPPAEPQALAYEPAAGDEILVAFAGPARQSRLTVLVRLLLAIPHFIVLWALGIAVEIVVVISWFAALFTGQVPRGLAEFLTGYLRWMTRFYSYLALLTDEYPPFALGDLDYPVHLAARPGRLNRLAVFFRLILVIPAALISVLLVYGLGTIAIIVIWLIVLITGTMPTALHQAIGAVTRYMTRLTGYELLLTGTYPSGLFGDPPGPESLAGMTPGGPPPSPGFGQPPYGQPAPGFGQPGPGYGQPPYGQPASAYGQPASAYGQPPSAYGQPASGVAGYGQPAAYQPGFGPQGYPVAGRWPAGDQAWRLVLSSGAKRLVGLFLVLGALLIVAYAVVIGVATSNSNTANTALSVQNSYASLNTALTTFQTKTTACNGTLSCVTAQDTKAARAFGAFAQAMRGIAMPNGPAAAAANAVIADSTGAQGDLTQLATSTSISQYQQTVLRTGLEQRLNKFDTDYQNLGKALGT